MASSAPVAVTSAVATLGSSQQDGQEPPSSLLYQHGTAQANGDRSTGTAVGTHSSDLTFVGMWTNTEKHQTNTETNGVEPPVYHTSCTRHRKLSEACSLPVDSPQVIRILTNLYAVELSENIREGGARESSAAACTCVVAFEVYEDEAEPGKARMNGVAASERRLNGVR